jgi:2-keto-4-pentenoate hydratase/2-oxohepta-3-ene-1,7-dioic acid hydratase in catechol pathway
MLVLYNSSESLLTTKQCLIIGKDAKNVSESSALDYVAAYTCGNDVSARKLQRDPALAGGVPQWGFSKGFDTYAPLGPVLVSSEIIGDPAALHMVTKVDGEVRQDTEISDLIFNCAYLIHYLSQGTTLPKGTVIMTGTPGGKPTMSLDFQMVMLTLSIRCWVRHEPTYFPQAWKRG